MQASKRMAAALSLTMFSAVAAADDFPPRKPGFWVLTVQHAAGKLATMKMCIDSDTDQLFHKFGTDLTAKHCTRSEIKTNGNTVTSESECKIGGSTITTKDVLTFDGDTAYHSEAISHFSPALFGKTDMTMTQDGKWSGDCPEGMKPGDLVLANGFKLNVKTLNKFKSFIPGQ